MLSLMATLYLLMVGTHHRYCQPVRLSPREQNRLQVFAAAAWGTRVGRAAGVKVVIEPGQTREVRVVPFGGARIVRGHGGLVDGPLDAPGALEAALALARERGYEGA